MTEVERIVRIFHESWDLRDPERGAAVIADDCHFEDVARGELLSGPDGYKDDWAVVEFVNRGTQTGPLKSSLGEFPPTGRFMEVRYCSVMRVRDGKVVEGRDYYDSASIAKQLGLVD